MPVQGVFYLHGIVNGGTFLSQLTSSRNSPGINQALSYAAGVPQPMFVGNMQQTPVETFDADQLRTVLNLCGIGLGDLSGANTDLYYKKATPFGSRQADASLVHLRLRAADAALTWSRITAGQTGNASISCALTFPYDGTNEPVVPAGNVALAGSPSAAENFTVGPVWINGAQFTSVQEITIDSGLDLLVAFGEGELYPTFVGLRQSTPMITIRTLELPWPTVGLNGLPLTSLSVYLRARNSTGRVANGTASHIKFAATAGIVTIEETSAGANRESGTTVKVALIDAAGTGNALTVNTAIAITT